MSPTDNLRVQPVSRFLVQAAVEAHPLPAHPDFDGSALTLARLEDRDAWPNNGRRRKARQVYDRFIAEAQEAMQARNDALFRLLMTRGVDVEVPDLDSAWAAEMADTGIDLAHLSPGSRKLLYIHHLLPDPMGKLDLLTRVMEASGLPSTQVDAVSQLFRDALQAADAAIAEALPDDDAT